MFFSLRTWLFAITILLVAEDFQMLLKVERTAMEQTEPEKADLCKDCGCEDTEGEEKEEKKEEKKEKDDNKNYDPDALLNAGSRLAKNKFRDALHPLSDIAHELETPPPEV